MAIAFSSTIHTIVPGLRVAGEQIASLQVRDGDSDTLYAGVKTALLIVNGDNDINLAESTGGPFTYSPDIDALYSQLNAAGMYEVVPGKLLINPSSFSVIRISGSQVVIDIEGAEAPFVFKKNATATEVIPGPGNSWELPAVTFDAFAIAATTFRESVDLELEDLGDSLAQEIVDRMAADTAEAAPAAAQPSVAVASTTDDQAIQPSSEPEQTNSSVYLEESVLAESEPVTGHSSASSGLAPEPAAELAALQLEHWLRLVEELGLSGMTESLARSLSLENISGNRLVLHYTPEQEALLGDVHRTRISEALQGYFAEPLEVEFVLGTQQRETPQLYRQRRERERVAAALAHLQSDEAVQQIIETFSAELIPDSVEPLNIE